MVLETSDDKIQQICEEITLKTINPAKQEATKIINSAKEESKLLMQNAEKQKQALIEQAQKEIEQKKNIADTAINMAIKQSIIKLKEDITQKFFSSELQGLIQPELNKSDVMEKIIACILNAIDEQGIDVDLCLVLSSSAHKKELQDVLVHRGLDKIINNTSFVGTFKAGVQLAIKKKNLTIEMTDEALKELLASYVIDDLKERIFAL